jgi:hypothetical protein
VILELQFEASDKVPLFGFGGDSYGFQADVSVLIELDPSSVIASFTPKPIDLKMVFVERRPSVLGRAFLLHYLFALDESAQRYFLGPPRQPVNGLI